MQVAELVAPASGVSTVPRSPLPGASAERSRFRLRFVTARGEDLVGEFAACPLIAGAVRDAPVTAGAAAESAGIDVVEVQLVAVVHDAGALRVDAVVGA